MVWAGEAPFLLTVISDSYFCRHSARDVLNASLVSSYVPRPILDSIDNAHRSASALVSKVREIDAWPFLRTWQSIPDFRFMYVAIERIMAMFFDAVKYIVASKLHQLDCIYRI